MEAVESAQHRVVAKAVSYFGSFLCLKWFVRLHDSYSLRGDWNKVFADKPQCRRRRKRRFQVMFQMEVNRRTEDGKQNTSQEAIFSG